MVDSLCWYVNIHTQCCINFKSFFKDGEMLRFLEFGGRGSKPSFYISRKELKIVVRELLACMQPNRHKISTANMLQPRSARGKTRK